LITSITVPNPDETAEEKTIIYTITTPITLAELKLLKDPSQLETAFYDSMKESLNKEGGIGDVETLMISGIEYPYYNKDKKLDEEGAKVNGLIAKELLDNVIFIGQCTDGVYEKGVLWIK
jgi:hypothetical protein